MSAIREFDIRGPLPSGVTVLEASAGTGKTYTIASLTVRYVAAGVPLDKMLLVTFTRLATGELRERVRERLIEVERALAAGTDADGSADEVVALLASGDAETARRRLAHAIAGFDAATIVTTHSFCQEMLEGLGIAGELAPDVRFVEDLTDLRDDVVDDLYVRRVPRGAGNDHAGLPARHAQIARDRDHRCRSPPVVMPSAPPTARYDERVALAGAARAELELTQGAAGG